MQYKNIFWIEDDSEGVVKALKFESSKSLDESLNRVTWAPDFITGEKIVKSQEFDLYVLDIDFPRDNRITKDEVYLNGLMFYNTLSDFIKGDVVILSANAAAAHGQNDNPEIPCYYKGTREWLVEVSGWKCWGEGEKKTQESIKMMDSLAGDYLQFIRDCLL